MNGNSIQMGVLMVTSSIKAVIFTVLAMICATANAKPLIYEGSEFQTTSYGSDCIEQKGMQSKTLLSCRSREEVIINQPLPLRLAASVETLKSFDLSPDGTFIAYVYSGAEDRRHIRIRELSIGRTVELADPGSESWGAVWSPNGQRLAFFSAAGGERRVWVWESKSRKAHPIEGARSLTVPYAGKLRWLPDSEKLLVTLQSEREGREANVRADVTRTTDYNFSTEAEANAGVYVRRSQDKTERDERPTQLRRDLGLIDLRKNKINTIIRHEPIHWYALSPNGRYLGYTVHRGWVQDTQQGIHDVIVKDILSGATKVLATDQLMHFGLSASWSPDSSGIAWLNEGQISKGQLVIASVDGETIDEFAVGDRGVADDLVLGPPPAPYWENGGRHVYVLGQRGGGKIWVVDVQDKTSRIFAGVGDREIVDILPLPRSRIRGRRMAVIARVPDGSAMGIYELDMQTGHSSILAEGPYSIMSKSLDVANHAKEIAFIASDQGHLPYVAILDFESKVIHPGVTLNEAIYKYALGEARIVSWNDAGGRKLQGTLLLPPGYREGRRLPLLVHVYAGRNGSQDINRFGLWGHLPSFNFHVAATRGYAVLSPDVPVGAGTVMKDLVRAVMPGIDALIEMGFVDPERLAIMGQSWGAYSALALICQTKRFKAAVITAAVTHPDLVADYLTNTGYYETGHGGMGGSVWEYRDRYIDNSPIYHFDEIDTPILIGQGELDGDLAASNAIYNGLKRLGKGVELRIYKEEGHVISKRVNVIDFWGRRLDFISKQLDISTGELGEIIFDGNKVRSLGQ